ncbi:sensor histidine kinase [Myxacorys almedinensis]|uniref:histidine kinase n=1 Tax=Myxacorys almedinensis A TaxID=2690445 RepID=A0A8J7Z2M5_9CYAN|nr:HAMP domain-containing sensor histidine kinase [Myxacorys almedinensis]NDJ18884.1 sensor histidine kinase [Myxacorys almedinensis A]
MTNVNDQRLDKQLVTVESTLDSTALKRLALAHHMATELAQFKAGFLARTSHELRSPLNGLIGSHQLILSDLCDSPDEEREFVAQAHEAALKLVRLLDEIIHVSKAEYGSSALEIQPLSLKTVLEEVYGLTHLLAENRNLKFQIAYPDQSLYVLADPNWLRYVLVSLVSNAVSLMQAGAIALTVMEHPPFAAIVIEDERPAQSGNDASHAGLAEPIDLLHSPPDAPPLLSKILEASYAPGFSLLLTQTAMTLMNGRLDLLSVPSHPSETVTRMRCSIPLAVHDD